MAVIGRAKLEATYTIRLLFKIRTAVSSVVRGFPCDGTHLHHVGISAEENVQASLVPVAIFVLH